MRYYRISNEAQADLEEIWLYIAQESEQAANMIVDEIIDRFSSLAQFPELGRERSELLEGLRSFSVRRYIIFYRLIKEGIEVFRILHGARDLEMIFDEK